MAILVPVGTQVPSEKVKGLRTRRYAVAKKTSISALHIDIC